MDTTFTEEQEILRKAAADFLAKEIPEKKVREIEESELGYDPHIWQSMADLGWMGLVIPEKYGGMGMSFQDLTIILEEMGKNIAPGPFFSTILGGAYPILEAGTEEQKKKFLPRIAKGELIFSFAILESQAICDASDMKTKAVRKNGSFVLNGTKLFVEQANNAHYLICVTRTSTATPPEEGITLFIVDTKSPGITIEVMPTIAMDRLCEVKFKAVDVPAENMLGEENKGWILAKNIIERAAIAKACESLGAMEAIVPLTVEYLKQRVQFDQPLAQFQALQHILADMFIRVVAGKYLVYEAAWMKSEGLPCTKQVAMAKAYVNVAYNELSRLMIRLYGGNGTNREFKPGLYYRRAKAAAVAFGGTDFLREIVAKEIGLVS